MKLFSELSPMATNIVDAAEGLLQQHGYNGFSYDDIARIVGIKKPSVHHHFATKSLLVAVTVQRYTHRFEEHLLHINKQNGDAVARLISYAGLFESTFASNRRICVCGMLGAEMQGLPEDVALAVERFFTLNIDWLAAAFKRGMTAKQIRPSASSIALAQSYLCALEGAMVVGRGTNSLQGPAAISKTFIALLVP
jgi:TetR/AcrR family transcriptional regulator, transcriptional repressor for nem operon